MNRVFIAAVGLLLAATGLPPANAAALNQIAAAHRSLPLPPMLPSDAFILDPVISAVTLSPDGRFIAYLRRTDNQSSLWLIDTAAPAKPKRLQTRTSAQALLWDSSSKAILLIGPDKVNSLGVVLGGRSGAITLLGGLTKTRLLAAHPWQDGLLLTERQGESWQLIHARANGRRNILATSRQQIVDAAVRRDGRALFLKLVGSGRHVLMAWQGAGGYRAVASCAEMRRCNLIGVTSDGKGAWLTGDVLGDRNAVLQIDTAGKIHQHHSDPAQQADLAGVALDRTSGVPQIALYGGVAPRHYGLLPAAAAQLGRLRFGGDGAIETSPRYWLVQEQAADLKGSRWHLLDLRSGSAQLVLDDHPKRPPASQLADVQAISYRAADGMQLHGLLTLPLGRDPARVPLVTVVHGGPWSHDEPRYSALTQLLANRGYAVFRPQFRGSTGFGRSYMLAAQGDFGNGRVQRDIEDGTRFLLAQGIGDPRQTAIMGASFGGYATLQALSNGSNLYHVGVATVPPTDFGWTARWAALRADIADSDVMRFADMLRLLALDPADPAIAERLYRQSPRAAVAAMRTPLLLIAAGRDERVPLRSVIDYAARLKVQGSPATIVVARDAPHAPSDPLALQAQLVLTEEMLQRQFGGPKPPAVSAPVKRWMDSNLERW